MEYITIPVKTGYIKPKESYRIIIDRAANLLEDGDFLVISETPISVSQGRLVDESRFKPSVLSIILADVWSKYLWGYLLGPLFRIKSRTIKNLRKLPPEARTHKRVILEYYGIKHALKPASEAGVDLSNVPGSLVSLLPDDPTGVSMDIASKIRTDHGKNVTVLIIDTDACYQMFNTKFTSLPIAVEGIRSDMGFFGYLLGRFSTMLGPTPLGISESKDMGHILEVANAAENFHKNNETDVETVYDMSKAFNGDVADVTIEMLDSIEHTPAVIVRSVKKP